MRLARKALNVLRGGLQLYGPPTVKKRTWDSEFSSGRWSCLETGTGDCVYPYVHKYADGGSVLDLGCGSGSTGTELDGTYCRYTGVDISDVALVKARRKTEAMGRRDRNEYTAGDVFSYVPSQVYSVILFKDSIYYVPPQQIRAMLHRYSGDLSSSGVFIVRISAPAKYQSIVDIIEKNFTVIETQRFDEPQALVAVFR